MSDELREFLKQQIHVIFNDKSLLTRKLYMTIYSKIYDFCTRKNINKDMGIIEKKTMPDHKEVHCIIILLVL